MNNTGAAPYLLQINSTSGSWKTGWYSVILEVQGESGNSDSGYAWFNAIAFYVETQPVNYNGSQYKYAIRSNEPMYFNVTTTKSYKSWTWSGNRYNDEDYLNTSIVDINLWTWDQTTYQSKEYNLLKGELNATWNYVADGRYLLNLTKFNGTDIENWPNGYYWGEIILNNSEGEEATGWLWFETQPFNLNVQTHNWEIGESDCVNVSLNIFEPGQWYGDFLTGNYSIVEIYENIWHMHSSERVNYINYNYSSEAGEFNSTDNGWFNSTTTLIICPNDDTWPKVSYGGHHHLEIVVKDNVNDENRTGGVGFTVIPFKVTWLDNWKTVASNAPSVTFTVNLTEPLTGESALGNLTEIFESYIGREYYSFNVNGCSSNCLINGSANVTIYQPNNGWRYGGIQGYSNCLYATWKNYYTGDILEDWNNYLCFYTYGD